MWQVKAFGIALLAIALTSTFSTYVVFFGGVVAAALYVGYVALSWWRR